MNEQRGQVPASMPPPIPQYQPPTQYQRKNTSGGGCACCLRGCLISVVLLLVLVVAGVVAFQTVGRPYIAAHIPEWRKQNPWIDLAIDVTGIDAYFMDQNQLRKNAGRQAGENDKAALPKDIPVYPTPIEETYSISSQQVTGFQRVGEQPATIQTYFRNAMTANGWQSVLESSTERMKLSMWQKDTRRCRIELIKRSPDSETEVWIRCSLSK